MVRYAKRAALGGVIFSTSRPGSDGWRDYFKKDKKCLVPDAVISAAEMVLREERAGRAEAAYLFH